MSDEKNGVFLTLPLPDTQVFRYRAADDILNLLFRNPHEDFTITQLRETTGHGGKSVKNALEILDSLELIEKDREGRNSLIRINGERIQKPDDPIIEIAQSEFRAPVREFLEEAKENQKDNLIGVILFGSVARGEADRASDIDIQAIVDDDLLESRRELQDIRKKIEKQKFDGQRYEIQLLVESIESAESYGEKLQEIFSEGITLYSAEKLDQIREAVFDG